MPRERPHRRPRGREDTRRSREPADVPDSTVGVMPGGSIGDTGRISNDRSSPPQMIGDHLRNDPSSLREATAVASKGLPARLEKDRSSPNVITGHHLAAKGRGYGNDPASLRK